MSIENKLAVVTGAASGIGKATAAALAQAGANVIVADIADEAGNAVAASIRAGGGKAQFRHIDLTDPASIETFASALQSDVGTVDILVNSAGWGRAAPFVDGTLDFWNKIVALNFVGPMALTKALLPAMMQRTGGRIVNIASDAGRVGSMGETAYSGTKGALIAFTKSLAREVARYQISVNCVCPGPTDTPLMNAVPDKLKEALIKAIPFRRLGKPEEVAAAVVFFAGDGASYVTGQVLSVSGGLTMAG
jgi:2-hydroxycyclohexanecarboxyl-CoA dehydrogenase